MLELYQFEQCPYCAKVRLALSELHLDYINRSAPHGSKQREFMVKTYGQDSTPLLVDPARGVALYESDDIINYLEEYYS